jgi:hypothetical protein
MANTIVYNFEITSNKIVTPKFYTTTLTPMGKVERTFNDIVSGDGYLDVNVQKLGVLKTIIAKTDNANIQLQLSNSGQIDIGVKGMLVWEVSDLISSGIINCRISTQSILPVNINLTLIGI